MAIPLFKNIKTGLNFRLRRSCRAMKKYPLLSNLPDISTSCLAGGSRTPPQFPRGHIIIAKLGVSIVIMSPLVIPLVLVYLPLIVSLPVVHCVVSAISKHFFSYLSHRIIDSFTRRIKGKIIRSKLFLLFSRGRCSIQQREYYLSQTY